MLLIDLTLKEWKWRRSWKSIFRELPDELQARRRNQTSQDPKWRIRIPIYHRIWGKERHIRFSSNTITKFSTKSIANTLNPSARNLTSFTTTLLFHHTADARFIGLGGVVAVAAGHSGELLNQRHEILSLGVDYLGGLCVDDDGPPHCLFLNRMGLFGDHQCGRTWAVDRLLGIVVEAWSCGTHLIKLQSFQYWKWNHCLATKRRNGRDIYRENLETTF